MRPRLSALTLSLLAASATLAQTPEAGRKLYDSRCATCHGPDGNGGEHGPGIVVRLAERADGEVAASIRQGVPARGMPPFQLADADMGDLLAYLRILRPPRGRRGGGVPVRGKFQLADGKAIEGLVLGQTRMGLATAYR